MTDEELLALRPGDRVIVVVSGLPRVAEVVSVRDSDFEGPQVATKSLTGRRVLRERGGLELLPWRSRPANAFTANVYADWLDDHGHPGAAALLRRHFPLEDGR